MNIGVVEITDLKMWNDFVLSNKNISFFHLFEWKMVFEETYNLKTLYVGLISEKKIISVLPLVYTKKIINNKSIISLPFCSYAGIINSDEIDYNSSLKYYLDYLKTKGIKQIELRTNHNTKGIVKGENTLVLKLEKDNQKLWNNFDAKVRNQIRKAQKMGLECKWGNDQIDEFYFVYSKNMLELGTPVHSKKFFIKIIEYFSNRINILTVKINNLTIGAMLLTKINDQISDPFASSLKKYFDYCPNMILYWEAIKYGCQNGFEYFDFGRSFFDSGTFKFKRQWGAEPIPLDYFNYSFKEGVQKNSSTNIYRSNKSIILTNAWKKLPYKVSLVLGPKIRSFIP